MTVYPSDIDGFAELPLLVDGVSPIRADDVNRVRDATVAVETELGINPSGTYGTVKDRLDDLTSLIEDLTAGGALIDVFTSKGDLVTYTGTAATRLPVGSDGYVLTSDSSTSTGLNWEAISLVTTTTKGDLLTHNGTSTVNLAVGLDGYFLKADSTQPTGLKWDQVSTVAGAPDGANTALSNLITTTINTHLIPAINDGYNIGSSTMRWHDGYFGPESLSIGSDGNDYRIHYDLGNQDLIFNHSQADRDFRVAGNTVASAIFVDAVTSGSPGGTRVGFGTNAPSQRWHFRHDASDNALIRVDNQNAGSSATAGVQIAVNTGSGSLLGYTGAHSTTAYADRIALQADATLGGLSYTALVSTGNHEFYIGGTNTNNKFLNITTSAITSGTHILPSIDDGYDLGSSTRRWRDGYFGPGSLFVGTDGNDYRVSFDTTSSTLVFNENGIDRDIRMEGDTEPNCLVLDAGNNIVAVGTATPTTGIGAKFQVFDNTSSGSRFFTNNTNSAGFSSGFFGNSIAGGTFMDVIYLNVSYVPGTNVMLQPNSGVIYTSGGATNGLRLGTGTTSSPIIFFTNGLDSANKEKLRIIQSGTPNAGSVIGNEQSQDVDFRWEGSGTRPDLMLIDAGTARVGINRSAGTHGGTLDVDNLAVAESILILRDNGTAVLTVADGGALTHDGGAVFNEAGAAVNLRVESDTNPELLFISGTGDGYVGFRNNVPVSVLDVAGSVGFNISTLTTSTTLNSTHHTVLVDATGGTITITLPASSTATRRRYEIKKIDSTLNTVVIDGNASETIDGGITYTLTSQYQNITIVCNGSNWHIV